MPKSDLGQIIAPPSAKAFHLREGKWHPHGCVHVRLPDGRGKQHLRVGDIVIPAVHEVKFPRQRKWPLQRVRQNALHFDMMCFACKCYLTHDPLTSVVPCGNVQWHIKQVSAFAGSNQALRVDLRCLKLYLTCFFIACKSPRPCRRRENTFAFVQNSQVPIVSGS